MIRRTIGIRDASVLGAALVAVIATLLTGSAYWTYALTLIAIYAIAAVGLNVMLGLAGQVSFAQTTFMGIGGYGAARLTATLGWDPWWGLVLPAFGAVAVAVLIGLPLFRLRGHYFAMATFALALGTNSLAVGAVLLTGGSTGIAGVPPLAIAGLSLGTPQGFLIVSWIVLALALAVFFVLSRSHIGRAWRALATSPDVAVSLGVPVLRLKLLALIVAAVMGSVAGSLYAQFSSFVAPDFINLVMIINLFLIVFIGGRGMLSGPVLGAAFVALIPQALSFLGEWQNVVFFVLLLLFMLFLPRGALGFDLSWLRPRPRDSSHPVPERTEAAR